MQKIFRSIANVFLLIVALVVIPQKAFGWGWDTNYGSAGKSNVKSFEIKTGFPVDPLLDDTENSSTPLSGESRNETNMLNGCIKPGDVPSLKSYTSPKMSSYVKISYSCYDAKAFWSETATVQDTRLTSASSEFSACAAYDNTKFYTFKDGAKFTTGKICKLWALYFSESTCKTLYKDAYTRPFRICSAPIVSNFDYSGKALGECDKVEGNIDNVKICAKILDFGDGGKPASTCLFTVGSVGTFTGSYNSDDKTCCVTINNRSKGSTYNFNVKVTNSQGASVTTANSSFTTLAACDKITKGPKISGLTVSDITQTGATFEIKSYLQDSTGATFSLDGNYSGKYTVTGGGKTFVFSSSGIGNDVYQGKATGLSAGTTYTVKYTLTGPSGSLEASATFTTAGGQAAGPSLSIAPADTATCGTYPNCNYKGNFTITLKDASGAPMAGKIVGLMMTDYSGYGDEVSTNANGRANVLLTNFSDKSRTYTLRATYGSASATYKIDVASVCANCKAPNQVCGDGQITGTEDCDPRKVGGSGCAANYSCNSTTCKCEQANSICNKDYICNSSAGETVANCPTDCTKYYACDANSGTCPPVATPGVQQSCFNNKNCATSQTTCLQTCRKANSSLIYSVILKKDPADCLKVKATVTARCNTAAGCKNVTVAYDINSDWAKVFQAYSPTIKRGDYETETYLGDLSYWEAKTFSFDIRYKASGTYSYFGTPSHVDSSGQDVTGREQISQSGDYTGPIVINCANPPAAGQISGLSLLNYSCDTATGNLKATGVFANYTENGSGIANKKIDFGKGSPLSTFASALTTIGGRASLSWSLVFKYGIKTPLRATLSGDSATYQEILVNPAQYGCKPAVAPTNNYQFDLKVENTTKCKEKKFTITAKCLNTTCAGGILDYAIALPDQASIVTNVNGVEKLLKEISFALPKSSASPTQISFIVRFVNGTYEIGNIGNIALYTSIGEEFFEEETAEEEINGGFKTITPTSLLIDCAAATPTNNYQFDLKAENTAKCNEKKFTITAKCINATGCLGGKMEYALNPDFKSIITFIDSSRKLGSIISLKLPTAPNGTSQVSFTVRFANGTYKIGEIGQISLYSIVGNESVEEGVVEEETETEEMTEEETAEEEANGGFRTITPTSLTIDCEAPPPTYGTIKVDTTISDAGGCTANVIHKITCENTGKPCNGQTASGLLFSYQLNGAKGVTYSGDTSFKVTTDAKGQSVSKYIGNLQSNTSKSISYKISCNKSDACKQDTSISSGSKFVYGNIAGQPIWGSDAFAFTSCGGVMPDNCQEYSNAELSIKCLAATNATCNSAVFKYWPTSKTKVFGDNPTIKEIFAAGTGKLISSVKWVAANPPYYQIDISGFSLSDGNELSFKLPKYISLGSHSAAYKESMGTASGKINHSNGSYNTNYFSVINAFLEPCCGNTVCDADKGETTVTCPVDCKNEQYPALTLSASHAYANCQNGNTANAQLTVNLNETISNKNIQGASLQLGYALPGNEPASYTTFGPTDSNGNASIGISLPVSDYAGKEAVVKYGDKAQVRYDLKSVLDVCPPVVENAARLEMYLGQNDKAETRFVSANSANPEILLNEFTIIAKNADVDLKKLIMHFEAKDKNGNIKNVTTLANAAYLEIDGVSYGGSSFSYVTNGASATFQDMLAILKKDQAKTIKIIVDMKRLGDGLQEGDSFRAVMGFDPGNIVAYKSGTLTPISWAAGSGKTIDGNWKTFRAAVVGQPVISPSFSTISCADGQNFKARINVDLKDAEGKAIKGAAINYWIPDSALSRSVPMGTLTNELGNTWVDMTAPISSYNGKLIHFQYQNAEVTLPFTEVKQVCDKGQGDCVGDFSVNNALLVEPVSAACINGDLMLKGRVNSASGRIKSAHFIVKDNMGSLAMAPRYVTNLPTNDNREFVYVGVGECLKLKSGQSYYVEAAATDCKTSASKGTVSFVAPKEIVEEPGVVTFNVSLGEPDCKPALAGSGQVAADINVSLSKGGKPVSGATVYCSGPSTEPNKYIYTLTTDSTGQAAVKLFTQPISQLLTYKIYCAYRDPVTNKAYSSETSTAKIYDACKNGGETPPPCTQKGDKTSNPKSCCDGLYYSPASNTCTCGSEGQPLPTLAGATCCEGLTLVNGTCRKAAPNPCENLEWSMETSNSWEKQSGYMANFRCISGGMYIVEYSGNECKRYHAHPLGELPSNKNLDLAIEAERKTFATEQEAINAALGIKAKYFTPNKTDCECYNGVSIFGESHLDSSGKNIIEYFANYTSKLLPGLTHLNHPIKSTSKALVKTKIDTDTKFLHDQCQGTNAGCVKEGGVAYVGQECCKGLYMDPLSNCVKEPWGCAEKGEKITKDKPICCNYMNVMPDGTCAQKQYDVIYSKTQKICGHIFEDQFPSYQTYLLDTPQNCVASVEEFLGNPVHGGGSISIIPFDTASENGSIPFDSLVDVNGPIAQNCWISVAECQKANKVVANKCTENGKAPADKKNPNCCANLYYSPAVNKCTCITEGPLPTLKGAVCCKGSTFDKVKKVCVKQSEKNYSSEIKLEFASQFINSSNPIYGELVVDGGISYYVTPLKSDIYVNGAKPASAASIYVFSDQKPGYMYEKSGITIKCSVPKGDIVSTSNCKNAYKIKKGTRVLCAVQSGFTVRTPGKYAFGIDTLSFSRSPCGSVSTLNRTNSDLKNGKFVTDYVTLDKSCADIGEQRLANKPCCMGLVYDSDNKCCEKKFLNTNDPKKTKCMFPSMQPLEKPAGVSVELVNAATGEKGSDMMARIVGAQKGVNYKPQFILYPCDNKSIAIEMGRASTLTTDNSYTFKPDYLFLRNSGFCVGARIYVNGQAIDSVKDTPFK